MILFRTAFRGWRRAKDVWCQNGRRNSPRIPLLYHSLPENGAENGHHRRLYAALLVSPVTSPLTTVVTNLQLLFLELFIFLLAFAANNYIFLIQVKSSIAKLQWVLELPVLFLFWLLAVAKPIPLFLLHSISSFHILQ